MILEPPWLWRRVHLEPTDHCPSPPLSACLWKVNIFVLFCNVEYSVVNFAIWLWLQSIFLPHSYPQLNAYLCYRRGKITIFNDCTNKQILQNKQVIGHCCIHKCSHPTICLALPHDFFHSKESFIFSRHSKLDTNGMEANQNNLGFLKPTSSLKTISSSLKPGFQMKPKSTSKHVKLPIYAKPEAAAINPARPCY